jgi:hypothetical protein
MRRVDSLLAGELQLGPGSIDAAMRVRPSDSVEVRSYNKDDGAAFAVGHQVRRRPPGAPPARQAIAPQQ